MAAATSTPHTLFPPRHAAPASKGNSTSGIGASRTSRWHAKTSVTAADARIAAECNISPVVAAILRVRGYTTAAEVCRFFNPTSDLLRDPSTLPDIAPALARLHRAISQREPFLIFGDYDVDGVTSTALLVRALRALGANVLFTVPERHEGYGLSVEAIEKAAARGVSLILTADCGITAHAPAQRARALGLDLIITDHHDPGATLPDALAVINPKRKDSEYGFRELSGCGVAFKLVQALLQEHWPRHAASFQDKFIEFVGLAAVADCVPLVDENRFLTREGLRALATTKKPGLLALIQSSGLKITGDCLTGRNVGFVLAPRLNAAGRVASPRTSLKLLLSTDSAECEVLAAELEEYNRERQELTSQTTIEAMDLVQSEVDLSRDAMIIVAKEGWAHGVIGLVASRLVERYARPAIVLGMENGTARGSGRSIDGFDLHCIIETTRALLHSGGGHKAACGLSLANERITEFRQQALQCAAQQLQIENLVPVVTADCEISGQDITPQLIHDLEQLEPCGVENPEASLMLKGARLVRGRAIGATGQHLKWNVEADGRTFDAVWWRPGEKANGFAPDCKIDLCFVPQFNCWNGNTMIQLNIKAARRC